MTETYSLAIAGHPVIPVEIRRKKIKNIYIRVSSGHVSVSAPMHIKIPQINSFLTSRSSWILRHLSTEPTATETEYTENESYPILGGSYPLIISYGKTRKILLKNGQILMQTLTEDGAAERAMLMDRLYKKEMLRLLPQLSSPWEKIIGVKAEKWRVKKMKSRWGSAKPSERIICMNSELAKKPYILLEYVLVHELVHFLERGHNSCFYAMMDKFLPDWKERKKALSFKKIK